MKTNIQIFKNEMFGEIRTMTNEKGETFFVGKDVAEALGYSNSRKALLDHVDEEDKGVTKRDTLGGKQQLIVINESGLYSLILSSKLEQARAFKRWVTSEVLPAIRKTGRYEMLPHEIRLLGEKAEYCDEVLQSVDCLTTTQVAKEMSMTGPELYRWLVAMGILYWQSGEYMLYADGFRCGVVFYLLEGKETNRCLDFALMMAEYTLEQQIKAFGDALESQLVEARDECQRYGANHSVYDQLPPTFTIDDLRALKRNFCGEAGIRKIISRWYRDHWIDKTDKIHWQKLNATL